MSLIVSEQSNNFEVVEPGIYRAVCCDVVDLGMQETPYGIKDQIRIHWMLDQLMLKEGSRYYGRPFGAVRRYTKSLNEKSRLRIDLNKWRGRPFTSEELAGFDLENIIGKCCQLNIMAGEKDPDQQRFVSDVLPDVKGVEPLLIPEDYVRSKDRKEGYDMYGQPKGDPTPSPHSLQKTPDGVEDDVPF